MHCVLCQDAMLTMLAEKKLTPVYQYVREEGGAENRMYTVSCTVSTLVVQVSTLIIILSSFYLSRGMGMGFVWIFCQHYRFLHPN